MSLVIGPTIEFQPGDLFVVDQLGDNETQWVSDSRFIIELGTKLLYMRDVGDGTAMMLDVSGGAPRAMRWHKSFLGTKLKLVQRITDCEG